MVGIIAIVGLEWNKMSNENKKSMDGDHNASEESLPTIKFQLDLPKYEFDEIRKLIPPQNGIFEGSPTLGNTIELSLSEALRGMEATVKFLNQTKNEGRQEQRTNKDKENQKIIDEIITKLKKPIEIGDNSVDEAKGRRKYQSDITDIIIQVRSETSRD